MRWVLILSLVCVVSFENLEAMHEFDEIAHRIVDDIKTGRSVSPQFIEEWYESDPEHTKSILADFDLPKETTERSKCIQELEGFIDENLDSDVRLMFHKTVEGLSLKRHDEIILILLNYMFGIPK